MQLPLMGKICKAENVIVCLGYDSRCQDALKILSKWEPLRDSEKGTIEAY